MDTLPTSQALADVPTSEVVPGVAVVAWDGWWNLENDGEMLGMLQTLARTHEPVLVCRQGDWQMGWKGKWGQMWGMRLPCPKRAIRDASSRLFKKMKGKAVVNGDQPPNCQLPGTEIFNVRSLMSQAPSAGPFSLTP